MLNNRLPSPADQVAILRLLTRYCACADRVVDAPGWADCFTTHAVVRIFSPRGDSPLVLAGLDVIENAFRGVVPLRQQVHVVTNTVIAVAGRTAQIASCFARLDVADETITVGSFGRYKDVARCEQTLGWRLTEREIRIVARTASR